LAKAVAAQVYSIDKDQPVMKVSAMTALLSEWVYARPRFNLLLFAIFAGTGLVLAVFGVYGMLANFVAQRTQEIGVRMALGAGLADIIRMVLGVGAKLLAAGILVGLGAGLVAQRFLAQQVVNISTFDPLSFAAAALLLLGSGLCASWWVAQRASRVDPLQVLRKE
jgi:ABC-type antimicrobial peptide transport system permease subunit